MTDEQTPVGSQVDMGQEVDRIRDIIFGAQMREYQHHFQAIQRDLDRLQQQIDRLAEQLGEQDRNQGKKLQDLRREMLLDEDAGPLTDRQREFLEVVGKSGQHLLEVTDNLLDLTRIEAGRLELILQPQDLRALVEAAAAEFEPQLAAKGQRLTLRAPPSLPPALCDETRTAQIVGNLLSNAVKYTPDGGQIAIHATPDDKEGFLRVSVSDNGVGISPEDQPKLFSRFFRARSASRTRASGAGLGLHIARSLAELHGGRIWFESELDRGSTFYVTFPAADLPAFEGWS
ncbi:MAG: HAMP domain-containing histidine kinase [Anaerolineae bacterium]|nr:MAG: HAMP domain-containing histidine kinase [Anaerolineae bacterium]